MRLNRPGETGLARQAGENLSPSHAPVSTESIVRRDSRAAGWRDLGDSPTSQRADQQGVDPKDMSTGEDAV